MPTKPNRFELLDAQRRPLRRTGGHLRLGALAGALAGAIGCGETAAVDGPDAGVDASVASDASGTDAPTGDRSCSITTGAAGVTAVLHHADGSVHTTSMTDATGTAAWDECPTNAMMTFATLDLSLGHRGVTVAGVQPGDHFEVQLPELGVLTFAAVEVPVDGAELTMVRVMAGHQCSRSSAEGATAQVAVTRTCSGDDPSKLSILATARLGAVHLYSYATDVPVGAGGVTAVNTMTGWATGPQVMASATNVASGSVGFSIQSMRDGKPFSGLTQFATVTNNAASAPLPMPPSAFTSTKRIGVANANGLASRGIVRLSSDPTAAFAFDLTTLLPLITGLTVDNTTDLRPRYTVAGSLIGTDLGIIRSQWITNNVGVTWHLIVPSSTHSAITFPALPAELASAAPADATTSSVAAIDVTNASYAQILTRGYGIGEFHNSCADVSVGSECWFTSLQTP